MALQTLSWSPLTNVSVLASDEVRVYWLATGDRETVRGVSRTILASLLHTTVDALEFDYTSQGKPLLRNDPTLHYSTSHADAMSLIAVTRIGAIGVDIERVRAVPNAEVILRRFFPPEEMEAVFASADGVEERFMRAWTRGEASVKMRGGSVWEMATRDPSVIVQNLDVAVGYAAAVALGDPAGNNDTLSVNQNAGEEVSLHIVVHRWDEWLT